MLLFQKRSDLSFHCQRIVYLATDIGEVFVANLLKNLHKIDAFRNNCTNKMQMYVVTINILLFHAFKSVAEEQLTKCTKTIER